MLEYTEGNFLLMHVRVPCSLPLPLEKTVQTLEELQNNTEGTLTGLPNPELYIIVNSKSQMEKNSMAEPR